MLESLAFTIIFQMIAVKEIELICSSVLEYENNRNPFPFRRTWIDCYFSFSKYNQDIDESIGERAKFLESKKIGNIDALHLACAEAMEADYFITCDDGILAGYKDKGMKVMNPVDFVRERDDNA